MHPFGPTLRFKAMDNLIITEEHLKLHAFQYITAEVIGYWNTLPFAERDAKYKLTKAALEYLGMGADDSKGGLLAITADKDFYENVLSVQIKEEREANEKARWEKLYSKIQTCNGTGERDYGANMLHVKMNGEDKFFTINYALQNATLQAAAQKWIKENISK